INGAVRDVVAMSQMDLGIKALGACPFKTEKRGAGDVNVTLTIHNQMIQPGDYLYADWNGVLLSPVELTLS
ncbi:putative 4-hydroxy-4-methyl-2-oxoglutarate aldolase, partial [Vibrio diabolicus]|nr:putative 4-hydroxy-4-methyl-2-oxoglutarate aldolase [Vibrio diabolicus]